ncbi:MAG: YhbY family RNA-binding protein [Gammaproteobacteria bacterium]|nr:MAG: YhbY family RNA-binding protein [Gammaproteobacteria bacterium]
MPLSDHQRKYLRRLGHALRPVVLIGQRGLTDNVQAEFARALHDHELIKVRARIGGRDERRETLARMAAAAGAELIHEIGNVGLFYKKNNKLKNILLPDS